MKHWLLGAVGSLLLTSSVWAAPVVDVTPGVAGESVSVRMTSLLSDEEVSLSLQKPDGTEVTFATLSDELGHVTAQFSGLHTQKAGDYALTATSVMGTVIESFSVPAGAASAYRSSITFDENTAPADGESEIFFRIWARDAFDNPVDGARVRVLSSRNNDRVIVDPVTDANGIALGRVASDEEGISVLSVLLDDTVVYQKADFVFHVTAEGVAGSSGISDFLKAQLFEDPVSGDVAYYAIEDLPAEVIVGQSTTVRVVAKDQNGDIVKNYRGTVRFSSTDDRATLPMDYTYVESDQGMHSFFLAVRFGTVGEQTLTMNDLGDFAIAGSQDVFVLNADGSRPDDGEPGNIEILSPTEGTYKTARLTITGHATGLESVRLTDGPIVLIEDLDVDPSGNFVYQTPTLADGIHQFIAMSADQAIQSDPRQVKIDRTPPTAMTVEVIPDRPLDKNEPFSVVLGSAEPLTSASCILREIPTEFTVDASGGTFRGQFIAPDIAGEFPLTCRIADVLGNELEEPNAAVIRVKEELITPADPVVPTAVGNLRAVPGEDKVTLYWAPAESAQDIAQYKVQFGLPGEQFPGLNVTPDNRTQWYVDEIEACETYEFRVIAVDIEGNESVPSAVVEGASICDLRPSAPKTTDSGGDIPWVVGLICVLIGWGAVMMMKLREG